MTQIEYLVGTITPLTLKMDSIPSLTQENHSFPYGNPLMERNHWTKIHGYGFLILILLINLKILISYGNCINKQS